MSTNAPCPLCKSIIPLGTDGLKVECPGCQHEYLVQGGRLSAWLELDETFANTSPIMPAIPRPIDLGPQRFEPLAPEASTWDDVVREPLPSRKHRRPLSLDQEGSRPIAKEKRTRRVVAICGFVVIFALIATFFVGSSKKHRGKEGWVGPGKPFLEMNKDQFDPQREALENAFAKQAPLTQDEIAQQMPELFEKLSLAFKRRNSEEIMGLFDIDRLYDEMAHQRILPGNLLGNRQEFVNGLRQGMTQSFAKNPRLIVFHRFEIRSVKKLEKNEAAIIVRSLSDDQDGVVKMRWWVSKRSGEWKIYDMEDLDVGLRATTNAGSMVANLQPHNIRAIVHDFENLQKALLSLPNDIDAAERHLALLPANRFPPKLEALRFVASGGIQLNRGQPKNALVQFEQARLLNPEMPILDTLTGMAHNDLGDWNAAVVCLERYQKLLGDDADLCRELCVCYRGLNRFPEALTAIRGSLDLNPKKTENFLLFLQTLGPKDKREDVGPRFAKLVGPADSFEMLAQDCLNAQDYVSLEPLAKEMAKIAPKASAPLYYLALVKAHARQIDQALAEMKLALAHEGDERIRGNYWSRFFQELVKSGKALDGYSLAPDSKEAFRLIASDLQKHFQLNDLRSLVAMHRKKAPDDSLLPLFTAELLAYDGLYEKAEAKYAEAVERKTDPFLVEQARPRRVLTKYHLDQSMAAYRNIGPRDQTFAQLVTLCWIDRKLDLLEEIVEAHAKVDPDHPDVYRSLCRIFLERKKTPEAIARFKESYAKIVDANQRESALSIFLQDMTDHDQAMAGYAAFSKDRAAFRALGFDLVGQHRYPELRTLLEAHRRNDATDPWIDYFQMNLHLEDKAWAKAGESIAAAWSRVPVSDKPRMQAMYLFAMVKAGREIDAYRGSAVPKDFFLQLSRLLARDKNWKSLDKLIAEHRTKEPDDPNLSLIHAQRQIADKKFADAIRSFQAGIAKVNVDYQRQNACDSFAREMMEAGRMIEGYRAVPEKTWVFVTLATQLRLKKKFDDFEKLLKEHGQAHGDEIAFRGQQGELSLARGDAERAEKEFLACLEKCKPQETWQFRNGLSRARIQAGKAVIDYRELGANSGAFQNLRDLCLHAKNAKQLQELMTAHQVNAPEDPNLEVAAIDLLWLEKDYGAIVKKLGDPKNKLLKNATLKYAMENTLMRSLIKSGQTPEALRRAEASAKQRSGSRLFQILALASTGDVNATITAFGKSTNDRYLLEDCYRDEDLGPILRNDAFRPFRDRFPEPKDLDPYDDRDFDD